MQEQESLDTYNRNDFSKMNTSGQKKDFFIQAIKKKIIHFLALNLKRI